MLQGIATDIGEMKEGLDSLQTTVQQLGGRITEAETRISTLEDGCNMREETVTQAVKTVAQLQDRVTYLEDAGRRNNVCIVGVLENSEKRDMDAARDAVLRAVREKGNVKWQGKRIYFTQDLSKDTVQKRKKYDEVKRRLRTMKDVSYAMLYPDTLKITANNKSRFFTTPAEAQTFISTLR
ncbi:hypothetical protein SKAU_G00212520 [Synaphobranchus kaupii]|uniref:L1 transposable element RRM domain-containing protein n=1 Tax=Synaphobranchus kaupii TaxID=118154 RepID=A0A9Q1IT20_SYNKA|nr:hypothetical protein SKAU_G00212520 [Synaphobranchus kaupii]